MQNRIHATVAERVYALAFDLFAVMMPTMYGLPFFASKSLGIEINGKVFLGMMLFVIFLYEPILVGYFRGTLGHKLMKLEIIRENGKKLGFLRAGVRYFLKSSLGVLSILSLMSSNQAIHDIVVKSFVVKK